MALQGCRGPCAELQWCTWGPRTPFDLKKVDSSICWCAQGNGSDHQGANNES